MAISEQRSELPTRKLSASEFNTALVHLYRGEVGRANTWRMRLDGTTNWAVLTTGATLSFAFSSSDNTHVMILLNSLLIFYFLFIEARRYRFYDLFRARIRLLETEFFTELLVPEEAENQLAWRRALAHELCQPEFGLSHWTAMGRRLRRNYGWIFAVLVLSWVVKVIIHPYPATSINDLLGRIAIGPLPAWLVLLVGVLFNGFLLVLHVTSFERGQAARDEVEPRKVSS